MKRKRMSTRQAARKFRKGKKVHKKNLRSAPMRGGWRI